MTIGTITVLFILTIVLANPSIAGESHISPNSSDFPTRFKNISHIESLRDTITLRPLSNITMGDIRPGRLNNLSNNNNLYLFSWDDIPGNDTGRLIKILGNMFRIKWIKTATIEKIDRDMTIKVSTGNNSLLLKLNDDKTRANLTINDVRTDEFIVKMNNNKLNIYKNFMNKSNQAGSLSRNASTNIDQLSRVYNTAASTTSVHNINKGTTYVTIQEAINDASPGNEIHVDSGTYYENVNVTKRLILRGAGMPVVNAGGSVSAITLSANGIVLEGFTATGSSEAGIKVMSNNNTLIGNNASSNSGSDGIYNDDYGCYSSGSGSGISLSSSNNNTLIGNNANSNSGSGGSYICDIAYGYGSGISLFSSSNNMLIGNNANSNGGYGNAWLGEGYGYGILLSASNNNTLSSNTANSNSGKGFGGEMGSGGYGYGYGILLSSSSNNMLNGNNANSNSGEGYGSCCGGGYGYGISLSSSSNNMLNSNIANSNSGGGFGEYGSWEGHGISLSSSSSNNKLIGNTANSHSGYSCCDAEGNNYANGSGVLLSSSNNNMIKGNNVSNNVEGVRLETDSNTVNGNNIYNNYFNNSNNLVINTGSSSNTWNTAKTSGTNIIGGPYLGGNFWAYPNSTGFSQTCMDADKDGICDAQYILDNNNIDHLPLAKYTVGLPKTGDINGNGQLTLVDAIYLAKHVGGFSGYEIIYADGDINANGQVTLVDAIYLAKHVGGFSGYEKIY